MSSTSPPSVPEPLVQRAPEGSECHLHSGRGALVVCPQCQKSACAVCWHDSIVACQSCAVRGPIGNAEAIPWEGGGAFFQRFLFTLGNAFIGSRGAPGFVQSRTKQAISFTLLTFFPLALLSGLIPYTKYFLFAPGLKLEIKEGIAQEMLAFDAARAMGISLLVEVIGLAAIALPYITLTRSYGMADRKHIPGNLILYRAWLFPASNLLAGLLYWVLPEYWGSFVQIVALVPVLLVFWAMVSTSRIAAGIGPLIAILVSTIPLFVLEATGLLLRQLMSYLGVSG